MASFDAAFLRSANLQKHEELKELLSRPGWYQWWVPIPLCKLLLGTHTDSLMGHLTQGTEDLTGHMLIYVGIAPASKKQPNKLALKSRVLDWHIRQKHSLGNVSRGFLSTFRQSLSALVAGNMAAERDTDQIIDEMKVELFPAVGLTGHEQINQWLHDQETIALEENVIPLNIQGNNRPEVQVFKQHLKAARSHAKQAGISSLTRGK